MAILAEYDTIEKARKELPKWKKVFSDFDDERIYIFHEANGKYSVVVD